MLLHRRHRDLVEVYHGRPLYKEVKVFREKVVEEFLDHYRHLPLAREVKVFLGVPTPRLYHCRALEDK